MTEKSRGAELPLAKIFSSDFDYAIPSYQRPYAWTEVQAGELFSDLVDFFTKEKDDTYFLGSIVLIKEEGRPHAEVRQRLRAGLPSSKFGKRLRGSRQVRGERGDRGQRLPKDEADPPGEAGLFNLRLATAK